MLHSAVLQVVAVAPHSRRVVAGHQRQQRIVAQRVVPPAGAKASVLQQRVDLEGETRGQEDHARQVGGMSVGHDQLGKGIALQLGVEVQAGGALQVVEAVTVLEFFQLVLEHEIEGRAEHAAEGGLLLG
ncbi:hypothetical protein D3C78_1002950 [compost metagenome]